MLRAIFKRRSCDLNTGQVEEVASFFTKLIECPEIERELLAGGSGPSGFHIVELIGVEVATEVEG